MNISVKVLHIKQQCFAFLLDLKMAAVWICLERVCVVTCWWLLRWKVDCDTYCLIMAYFIFDHNKCKCVWKTKTK